MPSILPDDTSLLRDRLAMAKYSSCLQALRGKFDLLGGELHDFDVAGAMKINYIPMEPRGCGGSNDTAREFSGGIFAKNLAKTCPRCETDARREAHRRKR